MLLISLTASCGPAVALDPDRSLTQLSHRRWTTADGLPGEVGPLAQTSEGYLWLGAGHSLFRFDGLRFRKYVSAEGTSIPTVSALLAAADGALWVGLRSGGVHRIHDAAHQHYGTADGVPAGVVYSLAAEANGTIWAAAEEGFARLQDERWHTVGAGEGFDGSNARAVFVDAGGAVWAASESRIFRRAPGAERFEDLGISAGWVSQLTEGPDGTIWIAHRYSGGLQALGRPEHRIDVDSTGTTFDRHGSQWIATSGSGVTRITHRPSRRPRTETFSTRQGLSADYVRSIVEDDEGNVWVGTSRGLDRFRDTPFVTAEIPGGAYYFALAPGGDGSIWVGSINRPVVRLDTDTWTELSIPPPVTAAIADRSGDIWLGGPNGIWRASGDADPVQVAGPPPGSRSEGTVRAMVRDRRGTLWVSVNAQGLFQLRGDRWESVPPVSSDPTQIMPVTAESDGSGRLWFGYRNGLVVSRDPDTGTATTWGPNQGVDVGHVTSVHAGARLWIGGQHGIAYLDGNRFRRLPCANDSIEGAYGIAETAHGDLWIYALTGAHRIARAEIDKAAREPGYQVLASRFGDVPALPDDPNQVRPLPALVTTSDGRLWFATGGGVVWVNPNRLDTSPPAPRVNLEEILADGVPLPAAVPRVVPPLTERLGLHYSATALGNPERLRFRFMLEGYDDVWQEAGERREAVYTRLPPGHYRFRVVAADQSEAWTDAGGAAADVIVRAAFHQTSVFQVLLAAVFVGIGWLGYRVRLRQLGRRLQLRLEERLRERERIARDLHDTLLQSVQGLLLKFDAATARLAPGDPARADLEGVLDRAEQVLSEGRSLVQGLRRDDEEPGDLAGALVDATSDLSDESSPHLRVTVQGDVRALEGMVYEEVLHIGREALINAFRHAGAAHVEVELSYGRRAFNVRVRDDGRGMDAAHTTRSGREGHFGIPGMYERAAHIGATLALWSRRGSGTEVDLQVPGAIAYRRKSRPADAG